MEKYGFVYIWYDRKHKRYYIGCRWGTENDGYICSSKWMKDSYKRRPQDFKRRVLKRVYNRKDLLSEEHHWLKMTKEHELGKRYYNLHNHHFGHWSTNKELYSSVSKKIKGSLTAEAKQKIRESKLGDKNPMKRLDVVAKRNESYKRGNHSPWNKGIKTGPLPEEHKLRIKGRPAHNKNKKAEELYGIDRAVEMKEYFSNFNKERSWFVNPETNECIHILNTELVPEEFVPGRCKFKKTKTPTNYSATKEWIIIYPNGNQIAIRNLKQWCKENGLRDNPMRGVAYGTRNHHKGFKCRLIT